MKKLLTVLCISLALTSTPALASLRMGGSFSSFRPTIGVAPMPRPVSVPPKVAPAPVKTPEAPKVTPVTSAAGGAAASSASSSSVWSWLPAVFMFGWLLGDSSDDKEKK